MKEGGEIDVKLEEGRIRRSETKDQDRLEKMREREMLTLFPTFGTPAARVVAGRRID